MQAESVHIVVTPGELDQTCGSSPGAGPSSSCRSIAFVSAYEAAGVHLETLSTKEAA
jgi:hypothetical protein